MRFLALVSLLSLACCVHARPFYGPGGERGFVIKCGGRFNDMSDCYNRAYEECRGPYDIASGADDQRVIYGFDGSPMVADHRELTVTCR